MAGISGLLGALSGPSGGYASLLDEEELAQAKRSAQADALLNLSSSLFKAGAPSRTPVGMGQALIGGLQGASKSYQDKIGSALQEKMNMQKMQQAMQSQKRAAEVQGLISGAYQTCTRCKRANAWMVYAPDVVVPPVMPATPARFDLQAIAPQLMQTAEGRAALGELMGAQKAMRPEMFSLAEGATQFERDPMTGEVRQVGAGASKMSDLQRQYNFAKTPQGGSYAGTFEQFKAISAPKTTNIVNPLTPDKGLVGDLQAMLVTAGDRKMRFNQIEASYRPEFSTVPYRGLQAWNSLKDRAGLLNDQEKANLAGYTQWRQNTMTNLARTINEISGTAAGEGEVARLRKTMPDSGTGVFDGDSPTEFEAKTQETLKQLRMIEARTTYLLKNGLTLDKVPLDSMPQIINQRGKEIAAQYKLDPSKPRDLDLIKKQLSAEFGISTQ
jgi:hypothetical protein